MKLWTLSFLLITQQELDYMDMFFLPFLMRSQEFLGLWTAPYNLWISLHWKLLEIFLWDSETTKMKLTTSWLEVEYFWLLEEIIFICWFCLDTAFFHVLKHFSNASFKENTSLSWQFQSCTKLSPFLVLHTYPLLLVNRQLFDI